MTVVEKAPQIGATRLDASTTMQAMAKNVRAALVDPMIWETARNVIQQVGPRDELNQARAVRAWVCDRFRFVNDPVGVQNLTTPRYMLEQIARRGFVQGNCADAAMLAAALCMAIHIPCRFVSVAFHDAHAPYSHVFTVAHPHDWRDGHEYGIEMDVTRPPELRHARFTRRLFLSV